MVKIGEYFMSREHYAEAMVYFTKAVEMNPELSRAYVNLLRFDRRFQRKRLAPSLNYCAMIFLAEEACSPYYEEAVAHLEWLLRE
jgi:tetratricopeptide (TPR) repeat protein